MSLQITEQTKDVITSLAYVGASLAAGGAFGLGAAAVTMRCKTVFGQVFLGGLALVGAVLATTAVAKTTEAMADRTLSPLVIGETASEEEATA